MNRSPNLVRLLDTLGWRRAVSFVLGVVCVYLCAYRCLQRCTAVPPVLRQSGCSERTCMGKVSSAQQ